MGYFVLQKIGGLQYETNVSCTHTRSEEDEK